MPSLPAGEIDIVYDFRMLAGVPTYEVDLKMSQWMPKYPQLTIVANGLEGQDFELFIDGLDTTTPRNVEVNAVFSPPKKTSPFLGFPWTCSTMRACASNPHMPSSLTTMRSLRVEALVVGIPQSTDVSSVIGDVLLLNLTVPEDSSHDQRAFRRFFDAQTTPLC